MLGCFSIKDMQIKATDRSQPKPICSAKIRKVVKPDAGRNMGLLEPSGPIAGGVNESSYPGEWSGPPP